MHMTGSACRAGGALISMPTGAVLSRARMRSVNPLAPTRLAARPLPSIYPVDTAMPASWRGSSVARCTGMWRPLTRLAACAQVSGP